ncbi:MAG: LacI family DNA-binding transcriptional regulator [Thermoguttaceae bacterium]|jgi:LacI family transcriptional regulator|nr:LacI family DNA-binding transcriptional regulator [Thermoguttaceae bacterium]
MATTLRDIAAAAETSVSTVSRVLSGHPGISTEMTVKVRQEAKRLGYRGRSVRRRFGAADGLSQKCIALLALGIDRSLLTVPAVASILHGAEAALTEAGARVQMAHIPDMTVVPASVDLASLDGAVLHGAFQGNQLEVVSGRLLKRLRQVPTVWLLGRPRGGWGDAVAADDYQLGAMAAQYLASRGHRNVAFVNPKPDHLLFMRREDGLLGAARRLGLTVQCFCEAPPNGWKFPLQAPTRVETVQHLVDQVLAARPRPTAIVAAVDSVAALIYRALAVRELRVGRDMSVISGNADHRLIAPLHPQLTTIDIHPLEIGRRAVEQLALRLADPNPWPDGEWMVQPTLLEGESVLKVECNFA